ncbi:MAG: hypothetical protein L6W00_24965 [Lentisphaeria bacterium]|nr:MAG: hypothetical protein L6W00_24965 [Lentisphaeria bacterium]
MVNCTLFSLDFYLEGCPKDAVRQQSKHTGIRISPFTLNTAFPVKTDQAGGKDSFSGLLVRLDPDYQPPRQEYPRHSSLSRDVKTLSLEAVRVRAELEKFLPVLRLADRGDYPNAVIEAEKIVPGNRFAAIMLYLIYSRGYCGVPVDYQTAAKYFDMLFDFRFHTVEYYNLWKKYRFMPTVPNEKVTLLAWWRYETMQEVIPLRGEVPSAGMLRREDAQYRWSRCPGSLRREQSPVRAYRTGIDRHGAGARLCRGVGGPVCSV